MNKLLSEFVNNIENHIYSNELIYRSILVVNDNEESIILKNILTRNDHVVFIIDEIFPFLDYNNIDCRILIMNQNTLIKFINHIDITFGIDKSSYNFIGFCYSIPDECVSNLISYYLNKTDNNRNNTIIFDKNYFNVMEICNYG